MLPEVAYTRFTAVVLLSARSRSHTKHFFHLLLHIWVLIEHASDIWIVVEYAGEIWVLVQDACHIAASVRVTKLTIVSKSAASLLSIIVAWLRFVLLLIGGGVCLVLQL